MQIKLLVWPILEAIHFQIIYEDPYNYVETNDWC